MKHTRHHLRSGKSQPMLAAALCACVSIAGCTREPQSADDAVATDVRQTTSAGTHSLPAGDIRPHATSVEASKRGLKNIKFEPLTVERRNYVRTLQLPAIVAEQPGRTQIRVAAPLTGIVTEIDVMPGEAIQPENRLVQMRLTHEDLVTVQREFLETAESLEIVEREINRLKSLGEGVIAGRRILEQQYEQQKLAAKLRAAKQALLLHGISEPQIDEILASRQLVQDVTVVAPAPIHCGESCPAVNLYHVQQLPISLGQQVEVGQELCTLADHCELFVEGRAFEDDAATIRAAAQAGLEISAELLVGDEPTGKAIPLKLLYVADRVDANSRAFKFFLRLPNEIVRDQTGSDGKRFIEWRFKPGQRMQVHVPVEAWSEQFVLPNSSVIDEGTEVYVYRQNGDEFERTAVHVLHRDQDSVVVADDGALFEGDVVAGKGAYQLHLAGKNQSSAPIDPHAGHNH